MVDNFKKEAKKEVKEQPKQQVKEVLVETKKDTSAKPTTFDERAKIEAEVKMIKVGRDSAGKWLWKRSDRITVEDKKKRESMLNNIRKGLRA